MTAIPPMQDLFRQAGMELPDLMKGSVIVKEDKKPDTEKPETKPEKKDGIEGKEAGKK